jgi:hypothetical protein
MGKICRWSRQTFYRTGGVINLRDQFTTTLTVILIYLLFARNETPGESQIMPVCFQKSINKICVACFGTKYYYRKVIGDPTACSREAAVGLDIVLEAALRLALAVYK